MLRQGKKGNFKQLLRVNSQLNNEGLSDIVRELNMTEKTISALFLD